MATGTPLNLVPAPASPRTSRRRAGCLTGGWCASPRRGAVRRRSARQRLPRDLQRASILDTRAPAAVDPRRTTAARTHRVDAEPDFLLVGMAACHERDSPPVRRPDRAGFSPSGAGETTPSLAVDADGVEIGVGADAATLVGVEKPPAVGRPVERPRATSPVATTAVSDALAASRSSADRATSTEVVVYLTRGEHFARVTRKTSETATLDPPSARSSPARSAPSSGGDRSHIPRATTLVGTSVTDGVATIDVSPGFTDGDTGGAARSARPDRLHRDARRRHRGGADPGRGRRPRADGWRRPRSARDPRLVRPPSRGVVRRPRWRRRRRRR